MYFLPTLLSFTGKDHVLLPLDELLKALRADNSTSKVLEKEDKYEKLFKYTSKMYSEFDNKTTEMVELLHKTRDEQVKLFSGSLIT